MTNSFKKIINYIHRSKYEVYIAATGAGGGFQQILASIPKASNTILESIFPYSNSALDRFLGYKPTQYCSEKTARDMATISYRRGLKLTTVNNLDNVIGIGITGVVSTDRLIRGKYRCYIATASNIGRLLFSFEFQKDNEGRALLDREDQLAFIDLEALNALSLTINKLGNEQVPMHLIDTYGVTFGKI